jgi:CheY-like chemotaxis protein
MPSLPASPPAPSGPLVLVVEDDPDIRELVVAALEALGCEVRAARDGDAALAAVSRAERLDLVLLDLMLPGAAGEEVLAAVRGREALRDARVVVMSAAWERARALPADGVLRKPFGLAALERVVAAAGRRPTAPARPVPSR